MGVCHELRIHHLVRRVRRMIDLQVSSVSVYEFHDIY